MASKEIHRNQTGLPSLNLKYMVEKKQAHNHNNQPAQGDLKQERAASSPLWQQEWPDWLGSSAAIVAATIVFYLLVRIINIEIPSLELGLIATEGTNPYLFGLAFQDTVPSLAILILIATTPLFQRLILDKPEPPDRILFFGLLAIAELITFIYRENFSQDTLPYGLLIVAMGGLIGGWRFGLSLGLLSTLIRGLAHILFEIGEYSPDLLEETSIWVLFEWFFISTIPTIAPIWVGYVAGHAGKLLGGRRYAPMWVIGVGVCLQLIPSLMTAISWQDDYQIVTLPAVMTILGLSMAGLTLLYSNIRGSAAERQAETIQYQLSQAELRALRAQINPHFLFNSLNTIRYFVRTEPETARSLLLDLSEVFQVALRAGDQVSLEDEIDFTKSYLALEQARLGDRLDVSWFIQSDDLLDYQVPTLILQPIVENAIIHGVAPKTEGGRIQIMVTRGSDQLVLQVIDDGVGMPPDRLALVADPDAGPEGSIGVQNIQNRLATLFGEQGQYKVESTPGRGTTVEVRVPLRVELTGGK